MNLVEIMKNKGATKSTLRGNHPHLQLTISDRAKDRFPSVIVVFDDEPNKVHVIRTKMSGANMTGHDEVLNNHNNLHSAFKAAYEKFLEELKENGVEFELNNDSY